MGIASYFIGFFPHYTFFLNFSHMQFLFHKFTYKFREFIKKLKDSLDEKD